MSKENKYCIICDDKDIYYKCSKCDDMCYCLECFNNSMKNVRFECIKCKNDNSVEMLYLMLGADLNRYIRNTIITELKNNEEKKNIEEKKINIKLIEDKIKNYLKSIENKISECNCCPNCKQVYIDYDACNSLTCANENCKQIFCGICDKMFNNDDESHRHVRTHGDLFDKQVYIDARKNKIIDAINKIKNKIKNNENYNIYNMFIIKLNNWIKTQISEEDDIMNDVYAYILDDSKINKKELLKYFIDKCYEDIKSRFNIERDELQEKRTDIPQYTFYLIKDRISYNCRECEKTNIEINNYRDKITYIEQKCNFRHNEDCKVCESEIQKLEDKIKLVDKKCNVCDEYELIRKEMGNSLIMDDYDEFYQIINYNLHKIKYDTNGDIYFEEYKTNNIIYIKKFIENRRIIDIIKICNNPQLLQTSIGALIGSDDTKLFVDDTIDNEKIYFKLKYLNNYQNQVTNISTLSNATYVSGPPGTGKTTTITALCKNIIKHCKDTKIIVLSERNGAIDAIATKIYDLCYENNNVIDSKLWFNVLAFGNKDTMGEYTKEFNIENKFKNDIMYKNLCKNINKDELKLKEILLKQKNLYKIATKKIDVDYIDKLILKIKKLNKEIDDEYKLKEKKNINKIEKLNEKMNNSKYELNNIKESKDYYYYNISKLTACKDINIVDICDILIQNDDELCDDELYFLYNNIKLNEQKRNVYSSNFKNIYEENASMFLSTIGSLYQLKFLKCKKVFIIIDESSTVPSYELLLLNKLFNNIQGIMIIGDKNQLRPYMPNSKKKVNSIIDSISSNTSRYNLETQYRIPHKIADCLNKYVYEGKFKTDVNKKINEESIIKFIDIKPNRSDRIEYKKFVRNNRLYLNSREADKAIELAQETLNNNESIKILTPYRDQVRLIKKKLKERNIENIEVITIDRSQGLEADTIIISLVGVPTRFLDQNRLLVAITRTKKNLYILGSKNSCKYQVKRLVNKYKYYNHKHIFKAIGLYDDNNINISPLSTDDDSNILDLNQESRRRPRRRRRRRRGRGHGRKRHDYV